MYSVPTERVACHGRCTRVQQTILHQLPVKGGDSANIVFTVLQEVPTRGHLRRKDASVFQKLLQGRRACAEGHARETASESVNDLGKPFTPIPE